ncbi:unnamed protein product [Lathyrus sativus]|nr:unnamed protein product [Lathyrus sativus]
MDTSTSNFDAHIAHKLQKIDADTDYVSESFQFIISKSQQTSQNQVQLHDVKYKLKEVEDELVEILAEKTRKEAKRMSLMNAIASAKARVGNLDTSIQEVRARKQEYTALLSEQSLALTASEAKLNESIEYTNETREAISWYNRVLGFHVKGGRGVKFTFKNINVKNPNEEYTFIVSHDKNTYTLLSCEPPLDGIEELVLELNKTNGLFEFVKAMRKKFQETLVQGNLVLTTVEPGESALISTSAPDTSIRGDSTTIENEHQGELSDGSAQLKKKKRHGRKNLALLSPDSVSTVEPGESAFISTSAPDTSIRGDSTTTENEHQVELSDGSAQLKKKKLRGRTSLALLSPDSATSAPDTSIRGDSTTTENEHQVELSDGSAQLKKKKLRGRKSLALLSPDSASSVRQSPRLKARK